MVDKIQKIELKILPTEVYYIPNAKEWDKEMKKRGLIGEPVPDSPGRCMYIQKDGKGIVYFYFNALDSVLKRQAEALMVHEVTHAVDFILDHIGETSPGMEFRAYLAQSIYQDLRGLITLE